jgi:predicted nucleic acid-binding protein
MLGDVHAPTLIDIEVTHMLERAEIGRLELPQLAVRRHADGPLLHRAWELRDVGTMYDGLYVALAEALDATLVTRDVRLARAVDGLVDAIARE